MKNRFLGCLILFVIGAGLVVGAYFAGNAFGRKYSAEITADKKGSMEEVAPAREKTAGVPSAGDKIVFYVPDEKKGEAAVKTVDAGKPENLTSDKLTQSMVMLTEDLVKKGILPEGTRLIDKVRVRNGVATLNFSEDIKKFSGGTLEEAQLANSLACTAAANGSGVEKVKVLVGGAPIETLGGHLDMSEPFGPDLQ